MTAEPGGVAPVVEAARIHKVHRSEAGPLVVLDEIDLIVPAGQFLAITGPSGSGKSTLLHCLSGLDVIDSGTVRIDGVDLASLSDRERSARRALSMGFVFQAFNLISVLTAEQNVALALQLGGVERGEALGRARRELDRVGLGARRSHLPSRLSGGEQQRVAIARATAPKPRILWADEPTGSLDRASSADVLDLFEQAHAAGVTVILVTHDPDLAALAQRRIALCDGRIVTDDKSGIGER